MVRGPAAGKAAAGQGVASQPGSSLFFLTTFTLTSAADVRALAEKIDFGKVTKIDERGRRIVVRADVSKLSEPLPQEMPPWDNPALPSTTR
ncbi:MAG TPA: hypothetical protein VFI31_30605 [Pirellulales bacterium]|nr:hypothetical protein [Pirellulales bacterium]